MQRCNTQLHTAVALRERAPKRTYNRLGRSGALILAAVLFGATPSIAQAHGDASPDVDTVTLTTEGVLAQLAHAEVDHNVSHDRQNDDGQHAIPQWWLVTPEDVFVPLEHTTLEHLGGQAGDVVKLELTAPALPVARAESEIETETEATSDVEGDVESAADTSVNQQTEPAEATEPTEPTEPTEATEPTETVEAEPLDPSTDTLVEAHALAAANEGRSLAVESLEVVTSAAEVMTSRSAVVHTIDVVYSGPRSVWPAAATLRAQADRAMAYWAGQTDNVVNGVTGSVNYLDQPNLGCGSWAHAAAAAQLSGRSAYDFMMGQYPGRHLLILSYGCSGGEATLGTLHGGGWAWAGMGRRSVADNHWIMVHELGHNLGLGHGYARNCSGLAVDDVWGGATCSDVAYADMFNPMGGSSGPGVTSIPIAQRHLLLGSVAERYIRGVTAAQSGGSTEVTIHALGGTTGVRGVRVTPAVGDPFYIEYREPVGADAAVQQWPMALIGSHAYTQPGVRVTKARQDSASPWSYNNYISTALSHVRNGYRVFSFGVGDSITPQGGSTRVTVTAMGGGSARVRIDFAQGAEPSPAFSGPVSERIFGADRYATAAAVSRAGFPDPGAVDTVVLATGAQFPDALAGAPLAKLLNAPLLLNQQDALTQSTKAELQRLRPKRVILLGGTPSLSAGVEKELRLRYQVKRISGNDRYETAAKIMDFGWPSGSDSLFVATGNNFPDALSLGSAAAASGAPILLVPGLSGSLSAETKAILSQSGASQAFIAGSTAAVSLGIESDVRRSVAQVDRFSGTDRFDTATKIGKRFGSDGAPVFIASGSIFPDAIAASVYVATLPGATMVLSRPECLSQPVVTHLREKGPSRVVVLGSTRSLSAEVANYQRCWF